MQISTQLAEDALLPRILRIERVALEIVASFGRERLDASDWVRDKVRNLRAQLEPIDSVGPSFELAAGRIRNLVERDTKSFASLRDLDPSEVVALERIALRSLPGVAKEANRFRRESLAKVSDLEETQIDRFGEILDDAERRGLRVEEVRKKVQAEFEVSRQRAETLAREQVLRFNSRVTMQRQTQAGVVEYVWSTSKNDRVRPTHEALEGQICRWDDPPVSEEDGSAFHPGDGYGVCYCVALAILPSLDAPSEDE